MEKSVPKKVKESDVDLKLEQQEGKNYSFTGKEQQENDQETVSEETESDNQREPDIAGERMETDDTILESVEELVEVEEQVSSASEPIRSEETARKTTDDESDLASSVTDDDASHSHQKTADNRAEIKISTIGSVVKDEHKQKPDQSTEGFRFSDNETNSRKRRYDDRERHRRYEDRYLPPPEEPEEDFDNSLVVLDKSNSDLNMRLHRDRLTCEPLSFEGFAYLWAGVRASYGVKAGKICYECKLLEEHSIRQMSSTEQLRHVIRVGWSPDMTSTLLGEEEYSYAFCATGNSVANKTVSEYGDTFKSGDVIGCYLDFSNEEIVSIAFSKNGRYLGVAFTIENEKLENVALFPHVLCRNITVEMNFGQKEKPYFPHPKNLEDYVFIASLPMEERVRGTEGPASRKDCEALMMVGLPGAGKTHWVTEHVVEHPHKNYVILGLSSVLQRMKVSGLEIKTSQEVLLQHASSCLSRLSQIASGVKRNFIIDQPNVLASTQRRKMRPFEGFCRKAVVIVPSDEDYVERCEKRSKEEGEVSEVCLSEKKAKFAIPEVGDLFEEVLFPELGPQEAAQLVEEYREEARKKGPPPEKWLFRGGLVFPHRERGRWGCSIRTLRGRPAFNRASVERGYMERLTNKQRGNWIQSRTFDGALYGGYGRSWSKDSNSWETNRNISQQSTRLNSTQHNDKKWKKTSTSKGANSLVQDDTFSFQSVNHVFHPHQQCYNPQAQTEYSQQWTQYYQLQTTAQQQQAATVAQYQNYYANFQNALANQPASQTTQLS